MTYVLSDIHGEYGLFMRLLDKIKFSDGDTLISCGDIIDKGQDSVRLLKFISGMPDARCINGNHEYDFLKYYWSLMRERTGDYDGVLKKLREYFPYDGRLLDWDAVDWIESRPYFIEENNFICVHAGVPLGADGRILPLERATREQLVYDRNFKDPNLQVNGKCVFFGHTPTGYLLNGESKIIAYRREQTEGEKITDFYKIHLDTGTWLDGVLGCFCVESCTAHYVKKQAV